MSRHPSYQAGYKAFYTGNLVNPNYKGSIAYKEHEAGFNFAYFENLNKYKDLDNGR